MCVERLCYRVLIPLILILITSPSINHTVVSKDVEVYVYEIKAEGKGTYDEIPIVYTYTIKLIQVDNNTFRIELISVKPESFSEDIERAIRASAHQYKLVGPYNISIDNTVIHFYLSIIGILPFLDAHLFLEPELVKVTCGKTSEIDRAANELINAWKRGSYEDFRRLMTLFYESRGEYSAVQLITNFPLRYLPDVLRSLNPKDLKFRLTSTCTNHINAFRITYEIATRDYSENRGIEVVYSSTGWLIYAKYVDTRTYSSLNMTSFNIRETKLIETSNERLLNDMQRADREVLARSQEERYVDLPIIGLTVVLVSVVISILFLPRKR